MSDIFEKIGLVKHDRIELPVEKNQFVQVLSENLGDPHYNILDMFSRDRRPYKGMVNEEGFRMWKRKRLLDTRFSIARVRGEFSEIGNTLQIDITLTGYSPLFIIAFFFGGFFYVVAIALMMFNRSAPGWVIPVIVGHGLLMASIPVIGIRKDLEKARFEVERDLNQMIRGVVREEK